MERPSGKEGAGVAVDREAFKVARDQSARTIAELQKRYDVLAREHEELRRERDELKRQVGTGAASSPDAATSQLADAQKAILSIRQARDSVLAHNHDLTEALSRAKDQVAELRAEGEVLDRARETAVQETQALMRECDELRRKTLDMTEQRFADLEAQKDQAAALVSAQKQVAALTAERDAERARPDAQPRQVGESQAQGNAQRNNAPGDEKLAEQLADARHKLADLAAQTEGFRAQQKKNIVAVTRHLTGDREAMRAQFNAEKSGYEAQIAALQAQVAAAESGASPRDGGPLAERVEQQRLEISELNNQLEAARTAVNELRASLDEARATTGATASDENPADTRAKRKGSSGASQVAASPKVIDYDPSAALGAMSSCLQMLYEHPTSVELLEELDTHLQAFSERARAGGLAAVHRFSSTCGELTRWLRKVPGKINASRRRWSFSPCLWE
jgi:chromosome segregation ATPase